MKKKIIRKFKKVKRVLEIHFGNHRYNKFILISRARSGSSLLISLLNSHPKIEAHYEWFHSLNGVRSKDRWDALFRKRLFKTWVGCKLFFNHPVDSNDRGMWELLKKNKDIKIIFLQRLNIIQRYISEKIAEKSNVWSEKEDDLIKKFDKKVCIKIDDLGGALELAKDQEDWIKEELSSHCIHEVFYEDIVTESDRVMQEIFETMGLHNVQTATHFRRQNPELIEDLVTNYPELQNAFAGTKYESMLV